MALASNLNLALHHLKSKNFGGYLSALAALGVNISSLLKVSSSKALAAQIEQSPNAIPTLDLPTFNKEISAFSPEVWCDIQINAKIFKNLWQGNHFRHAVNNASFFTDIHKKKLSRTNRQQIHLGMLAIDNICQLKNTKLKSAIITDVVSLQQIANDIFFAINHFETPRQKLVKYFAKFLVLMSSFAFGVLETGVATFFVSLMLFHPVSLLAVGGLLAGSICLGAIFSYISYCTMKDDIPFMLHEAAGKDKFLQGFREYTDENGKIKEFSKKQTAALGFFSLIFALPSALTTGAFGFTAALSIPTILLKFGIVVTAAIFPPLGVAFAIIITATMMLFTIRSFHKFIAKHNGNPISFLRKPFDEVSDIINEQIDPKARPAANITAKALAMIATTLICGLGMAGLVISAVTSINSVAALMVKLFRASTLVGNVIGIIISGIFSLVSRLFLTTAKCGDLAVNLLKALCKKAVGKIDRFGMLAVFVDLALSAISWFDTFTRSPINHPLVPLPQDKKIAFLATSCTTMKDAGMIINSMLNEVTVVQDVKLNEEKVCTPESKFPLSKTQNLLQTYSLFKKAEEGKQAADNMPETVNSDAYSAKHF